ncbi:hypothetical protein BB560_005483 [Smittium megazygosporum]|uniref:Uncharacterized protein n=1 Tax=Smittium megazygosporum TaxID=133381 RepID=A0A2T9Z4T2_9FUNG|nr:hypothetical protein BB560_005483 [Smittium megazygosporum]
MYSRLANKSVLITGASAGIGYYTAMAFAEHGSNLILLARRLERLEELKKEINSLYPSVDVKVYKVDVSSHEDIKQAFKTILKESPVIDILINNAGLGVGADPVTSLAEEDMQIMFDTNVKGLVWVTQQVFPSMSERNSGHIINVGSIAGIQINTFGGCFYGATKHAVHALTEALRIQTVATDIRVSEVCPGLTETEFALVRSRGDKELEGNLLKGLTPLTGQDVAEIIAFTASTHPRCVLSQAVVLPSCQANTFIAHRKD